MGSLKAKQLILVSNIILTDPYVTSRDLHGRKPYKFGVHVVFAACGHSLQLKEIASRKQIVSSFKLLFVFCYFTNKMVLFGFAKSKAINFSFKYYFDRSICNLQRLARQKTIQIRSSCRLCSMWTLASTQRNRFTQTDCQQFLQWLTHLTILTRSTRFERKVEAHVQIGDKIFLTELNEKYHKDNVPAIHRRFVASHTVFLSNSN